LHFFLVQLSGNRGLSWLRRLKSVEKLGLFGIRAFFADAGALKALIYFALLAGFEIVYLIGLRPAPIIGRKVGSAS
jgi:hypothetical protein